jgi:predicted SprT family Zn-dependent metalloprotease
MMQKFNKMTTNSTNSLYDTFRFLDENWDQFEHETKLIFLENIFKRIKKAYGLNDNWTLTWNDSHTEMGICYKFKPEISLSRWFIKFLPFYISLDTILHEIAHAICFENNLNDTIDGHGTTWKQIATELGAVPKAVYPLSVIDTNKFWSQLKKDKPVHFYYKLLLESFIHWFKSVSLLRKKQ